MADNMRHVPKDSMMHGEDGTGLASSSNQTDDLEDVKGIFTQLKISPSEPDPAASKGFTFSEVNCWRPASSRKLVCCNFSSDGRILASAGHENKAVVWNMDTFQTHHLPEEHAYLITDVCFRPNSTQMATSAFDKTIKLWNARDVSYA
ncbi:transcriptional corepressor LEUNIG_HOMOLOG-like [Aegilops tauschii subsp. strangulata]|nr:transcriptional corepressor LEUNIG_HOMOLOG-like isoform X2 [Aegilops tauschii subsp. strangulata]